MEILPPELQTLILRKLDLATLMKCRRVSHEWKGMIEQKSVLSEIFVRFPLPAVNLSSLPELEEEAGEEDRKAKRFGEALYYLFDSLNIQRIKRITITKNILKDKNFELPELLTVWMMPYSLPGIFDVVRIEKAMVKYMDWVQLFTMASVTRKIAFRDRPGEIVERRPEFTLEISNVLIPGMMSPAYEFGNVADVLGMIESLTIPGHLDELEKFLRFQRAYQEWFDEPLPAERREILQNFCETFTFQQAKELRLYETAFQFVEKPEEETEEEEKQRWAALDVNVLEPLTQALIQDYMTELIKWTNQPFGTPTKCVYAKKSIA